MVGTEWTFKSGAWSKTLGHFTLFVDDVGDLGFEWDVSSETENGIRFGYSKSFEEGKQAADTALNELLVEKWKHVVTV